RIAFYASAGQSFQILAALALKIAFRREHRDRTNQHNTAAQQASRACVLRLCIIQVIRASTTQLTYGSLHRYAIPGAAGQLWRLTPCSWCPVRIVEFGLDDLAIYKRIEYAFALRNRAEFFIGLLKFVEAS